MVNISREAKPSTVDFNLFDSLPDEVIQDNIGRYLTPKEALSVRLVNKRFAVLFGDSYIWRIYYRSLGLEAPQEAPQAHPKTINELQISNLAKQLPLWTCIQKTIDSAVEYAGDKVYWQESPRSLCIAALAMPELSPLHGYAIKILEEHCSIPTGLSADKLTLCVARGDVGFKVNDAARILALNSLSKRTKEPEVREALLSVISTVYRYNPSDSEFCSEAVKCLVPYLDDSEVQPAVLIGLQQHGPFAVKAALDTLITNPEVLSAVINRFTGGLCGLEKFVCNHLNNASVVEQLVQRLLTENNLHVVGLLAWALEPVANQKPVQLALCQRLVDIRPGANWHAESALIKVLGAARLLSDIKAEYGDRIPMLQERAGADVILPLTADDFDQRQQLLAALSSQNIFKRAAAATKLAPLVPDDPSVLGAFLDRIYAGEHGEAGIIIVSALAKVAYRKDIRTVLIQKGPLDGQIDPGTWYNDPVQRLSTVQALSSFVNEPEVRQAFLDRLKSDENPRVRCKLIEILAPQLDKQDVRTLFLKAAKDKLWLQQHHSGREWQVAAIDKLGSVANIPEVKDVLLQLFEKESYSVKAACIRALCADKQKRLIGPDKIFVACTNRSSDVRKEARRVLALWIWICN